MDTTWILTTIERLRRIYGIEKQMATGSEVRVEHFRSKRLEGLGFRAQPGFQRNDYNGRKPKP